MSEEQILFALVKRGNIIEIGSRTNCCLEYGKRKYGFGDSDLSVKRINVIELEELTKEEIDEDIDHTYNPDPECEY